MNAARSVGRVLCQRHMSKPQSPAIVEAVESRLHFAVTTADLGVLDGKHTIRVQCDNNANDIVVQRDGGGNVIITANGNAPGGAGGFFVGTVAHVAVFAEGGDDVVEFYDSADCKATVHGGDGEDYITGDDWSDQLNGGDGNDTIHGGAGENWLRGEAGDDTLYGGPEVDHILGGIGGDTIAGGTGNDILNGGDDNDWIDGEEGEDGIYGDDGDDILISSDGEFDGIDGGAGFDCLIWFDEPEAEWCINVESIGQ